jgi:hypothetical protein
VRRVQIRRSRGAGRLSQWGPRAAAPTVAVAACVLLLAGCGEAKQDAKEPKATYTVALANTSFPARQAIARPTRLTIAVQNTGRRTLPDVAVTVNSLTYRATQPANLADPERPTWIIYDGPGPLAKPAVESEEITKAGGAQTANTHTWALGRLAPGATKTFSWKLLPVVSGVKTIRYEVAADLNGKAKAQLAGGENAAGTFIVHVAPAPPDIHVNPETGAVTQGAYRAAQGPVGAVP